MATSITAHSQTTVGPLGTSALLDGESREPISPSKLSGDHVESSSNQVKSCSSRVLVTGYSRIIVIACYSKL